MAKGFSMATQIEYADCFHKYPETFSPDCCGIPSASYPSVSAVRQFCQKLQKKVVLVPSVIQAFHPKPDGTIVLPCS